MPHMKAAVTYKPGGPEVLQIERRPIPTPNRGQVLIRVMAFGLNRSEMFTRQGYSPNVKFPRILGIEAVGIVEEAPQTNFAKGDVVATVMGGMGRMFDGSYAEYTCVPAGQVQKIKTQLPWETLGAVPEMLETAWGSLFKSLRLVNGERLLIRGGTTSLGLAAATLAKNLGVHVSATSRNAAREQLLRKAGADEVFIDTGSIASEVKERLPGGADKVLELIGTTTLEDSLRCAKPGGIVCMTGIVGNQWTFDRFAPMDAIPTAVYLTSYAGEAEDFMSMPLQELVEEIAAGSLQIHLARVFHLDEIIEAHRLMEENKAGGKIVGPHEPKFRNTRVTNALPDLGEWPALDWERWKETAETLHMCMQIVGKARLALTHFRTTGGTSPFTFRRAGSRRRRCPSIVGGCST